MPKRATQADDRRRDEGVRSVPKRADTRPRRTQAAQAQTGAQAGRHEAGEQAGGHASTGRRAPGRAPAALTADAMPNVYRDRNVGI